MERHSLLDDDPLTPTQDRHNVFGDEFEVDEEFDGVVDGFGHGAHTYVNDEARRLSRQEEPVIRTVSAHYAANSVSPIRSPGPSRNSTRKSRSDANPFASPDDDETSPQGRPTSLEFEPDINARRSTSSASSGVYAQPGTPGFGAGPSHPYAMYQQGTIARTPSTATTNSTIRPAPRQSYSQSTPQHPYTMYPQGVDQDDLDEDDPVHQNPVPVGFPGLRQNYTRRLGPDGEDQDIIGEDGHAEQLPPYTRYPEEGPEKMPLLMPTALHSRAPVAGTDPGMPLMHTPLQPTPTAPQSMTDESSLRRHASHMSRVALITSDLADDRSSTNARKSWKNMTWKERRKTRWCGIPMWIYVIMAGLVIFLAGVLGGGFGGYLAGGKHAADEASSVTVLTSMIDASPIASSTLPPIPSGTFALTPGPPEETQCDCLPEVDESESWDCHLTPNSGLGIYIGKTGGSPGASLFYASYNASIVYGSQLSAMNTSMASFLPVVDTNEPGYGPAYYFQQFYDKIVVLPEDSIVVTAADKKKHKREESYATYHAEWHTNPWQPSIAKPGDKPWFCVWNNTYLEGFIYITETASATSSISATPVSPKASTKTSPWSTTPYPESSPMTSMDPSSEYHKPTVPPAETNSWSNEQMNKAKAYWVEAHTHEQDDQDDRDDQDDVYHDKRQKIPDIDPWNLLPSFPYEVKLEERRVANQLGGATMNPYCQQYQILYDGRANPVPGDDGNPIIVYMTEQDPDPSEYSSGGSSKKSRRGYANACHCQWLSGKL